MVDADWLDRPTRKLRMDEDPPLFLPHSKPHWSRRESSWIEDPPTSRRESSWIQDPPTISPPFQSMLPDTGSRFSLESNHQVDILASKLLSISEESTPSSTDPLPMSSHSGVRRQSGDSLVSTGGGVRRNSLSSTVSPPEGRRRYSVSSTVSPPGGEERRLPGAEREKRHSSNSSEDYTKTSDEDSKDSNPRFKTEICRNFKEKGCCLYGNDCQFAHGNNEMRESGKQSKYKTKLCQKYWIAGYCAYGPRCNFVHNEEKADPGDLRSRRTSATGESSAESLEWIASFSPATGSMKIPLLAELFRPQFGSGRLAAFELKDSVTWVDTWTRRVV